MPSRLIALAALITLFAALLAGQERPQHDALLAKATAYVVSYEKAFSLLVAEEHYVQEIRRPINPGSNLSRTNPGGGIAGGDVLRRQVLRSDYLLVQLGEGAGWMPFRDVFDVNGSAVRDREDRLATLFLSYNASRFDLADRIMAESTRYNVGSVSRTINIPVLAMMFLHPRVRERFSFTSHGQESLAGATAARLTYREMARPTLIRTTRGRDLPLDGQIWIEPDTGAVLKTILNAADPALRANVTTTFRRDPSVSIWVPAQMDEYYKEQNSSNEIFATATYSNVRKFQVATDEQIKKPPGTAHDYSSNETDPSDALIPAISAIPAIPGIPPILPIPATLRSLRLHDGPLLP